MLLITSVHRSDRGTVAEAATSLYETVLGESKAAACSTFPLLARRFVRFDVP